ncbi:MAG: TIGR04053 family radical SAM/SPASM domain-containing protein [Myxococcales bacterium]|nr:TIGR04053 family radical SAM/SPASM domain-containing protein [Myxococcales bacterium]
MSSPLPFVPDPQRSPFIAFWETTRACDLACLHCRACAIPVRHPLELSTEEGKRLLLELKEMGCPVVVITGGDAAKRPDLVPLIEYGNSVGLRMALTPSATPLVTADLLKELQDAGLQRVAISLDGAQSVTHDRVRGFLGAYDNGLRLLSEAGNIGLPTQVNTTITPDNVHEMEDIAHLIGAFGVSLWSVFCLVPTGRAEGQIMFDRAQMEEALNRLAAIAEDAPFDIKTTEAQHYRRVLLQRKHRRKIIGAGGIGRVPRGINDGKGVVFVSHIGDVYPSGFLPIACGNVRKERLSDIYREHAIFKTLRDTDKLGGKCGVCEFRHVCGGSRARAYAVTGDMMAEEPTCAYTPSAMLH